MSFRKIAIYINAATGKQISASGEELYEEHFPRLISAETVVLCIQFLSVSQSAADVLPVVTPVSLPATGSYAVAGDVSGVSSSEVMFRSSPGEVNIPGDWPDGSDANPENGRLSFRIYTGTARFREIAAGSQRNNCNFAVTMIPAGETTCSVLALDGFHTALRPEGTSTVIPEGATVYTKEEVDALIAGIAGANMSVEFSPDGSAWSSDSTGAYYWRFRISESGSWSTAIPIPQPASPAGAVEYSFTITEGATETEKTFTWTEIGAIGKEPVRLYQLQNDGSEIDITGNSRLQIVLKSSSVTFYWANDAFPAGTYVIRG